MAEQFSLKDYLFNEEKVQYLARRLAGVSGDFKEIEFVAEVMSRLLTLELKDRIRWIATVLENHLPAEYPQAVAIILESLPPPLDPNNTDNDFGNFIFAPFGEYVATRGCTKEHLEISLHALEVITMRFSMEDAVRYYLRAFPGETLARCEKWATHENYHVRRLVSEGTRPLLPWSGRVPLRSTDTLPLLTLLHADKTRYVTRSVANHLNDIAKREPDLVVHTLTAWRNLAQQTDKELDWVTKHALRTLIKQGNKDALSLLGYGPVRVKMEQFSLGQGAVKIKPSEALELSLTLAAVEDAPVLVDYVIHFIKKNGAATPKVFKWKTMILKAGEIVTLQKRHTLKADATTFTLYPGVHKVEVQINGDVLASQIFNLI